MSLKLFNLNGGDFLTKLAIRIKELRNSAKLTQEDFGKKFGIVKSTVSLYENGKSIPNDEIKKQICNYFHVSLDYLLGNTDIKQVNNYSFNDFFISFFFGYWDKCKKRIYERMKELSISKSDFINETNIDLEKEISLDNLITIAKKLDVTTDYLFGLSSMKHISLEDINYIQSITERERDVINSFRSLDADNKDIIIGDIKKYLKEQRYETAKINNATEKAGA